jgi:hypothetical protein
MYTHVCPKYRSLEVPYVTLLRIWLHGFDRNQPRQDDGRVLLPQTFCEAH